MQCQQLVCFLNSLKRKIEHVLLHEVLELILHLPNWPGYTLIWRLHVYHVHVYHTLSQAVTIMNGSAVHMLYCTMIYTLSSIYSDEFRLSSSSRTVLDVIVNSFYKTRITQLYRERYCSRFYKWFYKLTEVCTIMRYFHI